MIINPSSFSNSLHTFSNSFSLLKQIVNVSAAKLNFIDNISHIQIYISVMFNLVSIPIVLK